METEVEQVKRDRRWDRTAQAVAMTGALIDVGFERNKQLEMYGDQHYSNGIVPDTYTRNLETETKQYVEAAIDKGVLTWADILEEEIAELMNTPRSEHHDVEVVDELIQIAAVCVAWVEDIRARPGYPGDDHGSQSMSAASMGITPDVVMEAASARGERQRYREQRLRDAAEDEEDMEAKSRAIPDFT